MHLFRQTQTALSTFWMMRDGFRFDYATPIMGAPWSIPMEFPLYEAAVAVLAKATDLLLDGSLLFRTLPGPDNKADYDWSYWAKIDIH